MTASVAYPGRDGAHSAAACDRLFPNGAELVSLPSFTAVVEATAEWEVAFGVLPIESSLSGPVNETHDLLYESPLSIITSVLLRFLPSSTTLGRSGCFTSTASATRRRAFDTLTCRATLTCTICLLKRSVPVG